MFNGVFRTRLSYALDSFKFWWSKTGHTSLVSRVELVSSKSVSQSLCLSDAMLIFVFLQVNNTFN